MEISNNDVRLALIAAVLVVSLSAAYYLVIFLPADRQAQRDLEEQRWQAETRETVFEREADCQQQLDRLRSRFNNVISASYSQVANTCMLTYKDPDTGAVKEGLLNRFGPSELLDK